jgi:hypothetical protein
MKQRTRFDKVGYGLLALGWVIGVAYAAPQGTFVMGETMAYLAFGSGLFMCFWMLLGWIFKKAKRQS